MTKLLFVVLHEKEQRLEVTVEDANHRRRRVEIRWLSKDPSPVPADWFEQVEAELGVQDQEANDKAQGRVLF